MASLTLTSAYTSSETIIPNIFLDKYMPIANGEFVKVYLCLCRMYNNAGQKPTTLTDIADLLNHTEGDVIRAIRYWEKAGLLSVEYNGETPVNITLLPVDDPDSIKVSVPTGTIHPDITQADNPKFSEKNYFAETAATDTVPSPKPNYSPAALKRMCEDENIRQILFVAESLLGKTLTNSEINTILYIYNDLHFSDELLEYLLEYCVSGEKRSLRYVEKVAINWHAEGITTAEEAKLRHEIHSRKVYSVMKAFGINDRMPGKPELDYISRWYDEYGFECELVIEACNRTIQSLHKPSFEYTDTILSNWKKKNVHTLSDVEAVDAARPRKDTAAASDQPQKAAANTNRMGRNTNRFNNFTQRSYDFDALEKQLIGKRD